MQILYLYVYVFTSPMKIWQIFFVFQVHLLLHYLSLIKDIGKIVFHADLLQPVLGVAIIGKKKIGKK